MIKFSKMSASGNDYIVIDNRKKVVAREEAELARKLCARRFSVGADGLILLDKSSGGNDFRMRIFNPDGSEAEMCGNGARCLARFAFAAGAAGEKMTFETLAGQIQAEIQGEEVRLRMSDPEDMRLKINLSLGKDSYQVHYLDSGVPNAVLFTEDLQNVAVNDLGGKIRRHQEFSPRGANVNFAQIKDKHSLKVRTYERGVEGETLACGTGMVASAIAAYALGKIKESSIAVYPEGGGVLKIHFSVTEDKFTDVYLTGRAELIFEGEL